MKFQIHYLLFLSSSSLPSSTLSTHSLHHHRTAFWVRKTILSDDVIAMFEMRIIIICKKKPQGKKAQWIWGVIQKTLLSKSIFFCLFYLCIGSHTEKPIRECYSNTVRICGEEKKPFKESSCSCGITLIRDRMSKLMVCEIWVGTIRGWVPRPLYDDIMPSPPTVTVWAAHHRVLLAASLSAALHPRPPTV